MIAGFQIKPSGSFAFPLPLPAVTGHYPSITQLIKQVNYTKFEIKKEHLFPSLCFSKAFQFLHEQQHGDGKKNIT